MDDTGLHIGKVIINGNMGNEESQAFDPCSNKTGKKGSLERTSNSTDCQCADTGLTSEQLKRVLETCRDAVEKRMERYVER